MSFLLKNANIVNEGQTFKGSIVIDGERISQIIKLSDSKSEAEYEALLQQKGSQVEEVVDVSGKYVFPGVIDSHVHFREPGDGIKGNIESESKAAVLGGVTSFMDMPNNSPAALTLSLLEDKFASAERSSYANYSFYLGASKDNLQEIRSMARKDICGVKLFMGSSTGNLMVDDEDAIEELFRNCPTLIAVHCEDNLEIASNLKRIREKYGNDIPSSAHPDIRSGKACLKSSEKAVALAQKYNSRLHILHISTKEEATMLANLPDSQRGVLASVQPDMQAVERFSTEDSFKWNCEDKDRVAMITGEVCASYLWFCSDDYSRYGNLIKCNPAIKSEEDMLALRMALKEGVLHTIGSDHAPHLLSDKLKPYLESPSGIPLVQYIFQMLLTLSAEGIFTLPEVADRMSHSPARCFALKDRGFIREGYYADLVVADIGKEYDSLSSPMAFCRWSPFSKEGISFRKQDGSQKKMNSFPCTVEHTIVNGSFAVRDGKITGNRRGLRLKFDR